MKNVRDNLKQSQRLRRVTLAFVTTLIALTTVATPTAQTRNFIWKATGPQGSVYLVGSIHVLRKDFYPLSPTLDAAFKESDLLVEEVDMAEMLAPESQMLLLTKGMLPPGQSLEKLVKPETFALVSKKAKEVGLPIEPLQQFKPWSLAMMIEALEMTKAGFDPDLGLDKHFYDLTKTNGKAVQGFETTEYQLSRLDGMSAEQQERLLVSTLKELEDEFANVTKMIEAWRAGDTAALERLALADFQSEPEIYMRLLVERNRNWLPKIEALLTRPRPAFIVVGAAHLIGPDGLVTMLKAKGYKVEQL